jgi:catechol 2,3-dioxygenase-like lactoylglutathione lyase family enzyme
MTGSEVNFSERRRAMIEKAIRFRGVKVVALPVNNEARARHFYEKTLGLPIAVEAGEPCGYLLGNTILMLKTEWYAPPSAEPSPRITLEVDDARATAKALKERDIFIADEAVSDGNGYVASFLDSEGNKLWFCSYV